MMQKLQTVKRAELSGIACSAKAFPILAQCLLQCPDVQLVVRLRSSR